MTAPDDLPDHIWAQAHTGTNRQGRWSVVDLNVYAPASKYVRADVVDELVQALGNMLMAQEGVPINAIEFGQQVKSARAALARYRGGAE